jgi:hypothetical protein
MNFKQNFIYCTEKKEKAVFYSLSNYINVWIIQSRIWRVDNEYWTRCDKNDAIILRDNRKIIHDFIYNSIERTIHFKQDQWSVMLIKILADTLHKEFNDIYIYLFLELKYFICVCRFPRVKAIDHSKDSMSRYLECRETVRMENLSLLSWICILSCIGWLRSVG